MWAVAEEGTANKTVGNLVWIEKLESAPSPAQVARGQQEAVETVRHVMANNQPHLALMENPLWLPPDEQGRAPSIAVEDIPGEGRKARFYRGTRFCKYLNGRDVWFSAFKTDTFLTSVSRYIDQKHQTAPHLHEGLFPSPH